MSDKRRKIWNKSNGHCWYCGIEIGEKGWHADHFIPVVRDLTTNKMTKKELDTIDNLVPACASCNIQKGSMPIESWRKIIKGHIVSLNRDINQYKIAKRFGLIDEIDIDVTFWYESYKKNAQNAHNAQ